MTKISAIELNFVGVKVGTGKNIKYYIARLSHSDYGSRFNSANVVNRLKINGETPTPSFDKDWFIVNSIPKKIETYLGPGQTNHRYVLIDPSMASEKIPKSLTLEDVYDESSNRWRNEYRHLCSLYRYTYDEVDDKWEEVDFTYETILSVPTIKNPDIVKFSENPRYELLNEMLFPSVVLPNTRCCLTIEQTYSIIRNYVKEHIDGRYAEITSDYDFCFTVKKRLALSEPVSYLVDVNAFRPRAKTKYERHYRKEEKVTVFEMSPKKYQNYSIVKPFEAKNQKELEDIIQKYLNELMEEINRPLVYCECCDGTGVVEKKN